MGCAPSTQLEDLAGRLEAQAYADNIDFAATVGYERPVLPDQFTNQDDLFAIVDVGYFITDNARISGGYRYLNGVNIAAWI